MSGCPGGRRSRADRDAGRGELPDALAAAYVAVITATTLGVLAVARPSPDPTEALDMISGLRTLARPASR